MTNSRGNGLLNDLLVNITNTDTPEISKKKHK